jgi:hypothetical protein
MMKPLPGYPQSQVRKATLVAVLTDMVAVVDDRQAEVNMIRWTYNVILVKDDRRDTLFNFGMEIIRGRGDNQQAAWQDDPGLRRTTRCVVAGDRGGRRGLHVGPTGTSPALVPS